MDATVESVLLVGLAWIAFKALLTVLLLLGAGPVLRRTPLAPLVARIEALPLIARLRSHLPGSRRPSASTPRSTRARRSRSSTDHWSSA
jgi:hypothetical protein